MLMIVYPQGIYPTAVIVLVDVAKSYSERTRHEETLPTPQIATVRRQPPQEFISLTEALSTAEQYHTARDVDIALSTRTDSENTDGIAARGSVIQRVGFHPVSDNSKV